MKKFVALLISFYFTLNLYGAENFIEMEAEAAVKTIPSAPTRPLPPLKSNAWRTQLTPATFEKIKTEPKAKAKPIGKAIPYGAESITGIIEKYADQETPPAALEKITGERKLEAKPAVKIIPYGRIKVKGHGRYVNDTRTSERFAKQVQVGQEAEAIAGGNLVSPEVLANLHKGPKKLNRLARIKGDPQQIAALSITQALDTAERYTQMFNIGNLAPRLQKLEELRQNNPALDSYYSEYKQALIRLALTTTKQIKLNELENILNQLSEKNISDITDENQLKLLRSIREIIEKPVQRANPEKIKADFTESAQRFDKARLALEQAGGTIPE